MELIDNLHKIWKKQNHLFLISEEVNLSFEDLLNHKPIETSEIESGDVVSLVGDFDASTIITFLNLVEKNVIVVPLTKETFKQHEYFFEQSFSNVIIKNKTVKKYKRKSNPLLEQLRYKNRPGLVLFSTGTTGNLKKKRLGNRRGVSRLWLFGFPGS